MSATVDKHQSVGHRLEVYRHKRVLKRGDLLDNLKDFLTQLNLVQIDHVVRANHKVEVLTKAEAERIDLKRLRKLKAQFFSLLTTHKQEN